MNRTIDHVEVLRSSREFQQWVPRRKRKRKPTGGVRAKRGDVVEMRTARPADDIGVAVKRDVEKKPFTHKHYSPDDLAELWGVSAQTIRNVFKEEPGVLRLPSSKAAKGTREYVSMKIPESVAERVHKRYSAVPQ